ncbi:MAG: thioredoxin family protein [Anaerolineae bacterium]|nr:thioredoxin family protein [Anaerolineae bacterium]
MPLISKRDQEVLRKEFGHLIDPVKMIVFTRKMQCQYCRETRQIVEELAALSDKINVEVYDFDHDKEQVEAYKIDKVPAIVIARGGEDPKDYGIRYYGIPSGYEFSSLVEDVLMVSSGESGLADESKRAVADIAIPVHIQVFVTPTCPYCPLSVRLAHQLALESDYIVADMVEAIEFPTLSDKYQVMGVPRIIFNEEYHIEGAAPEPMMVDRLLQAVEAEKTTA